MSRVKRSLNAKKKRRSILKCASGYRGQRSRSYRKSKEQTLHSFVYNYSHRKKRKGDFRSLWIQRINAAVRMHDLTYSKFINILKILNININRKILAELAVNNKSDFLHLIFKIKKYIQTT